MSLLEQLAEIANPTPVFKDPEDDLESSAKLVEFDDENEDAGSDSGLRRSALRLQNAALLADFDDRYAGKKTSRREIQKASLLAGHRKAQIGESSSEDSDSETSDGEDSDVSKHELDDDEDEVSLRRFREQMKKSTISTLMDSKEKSDDEDENKSDEEMSRDSSVVDEQIEYIEKEGSVMDFEKENEDDKEQHNDECRLNTVQMFSKIDPKEDAIRGAAVKSQLYLWDTLLECRIKLQKLLLNANQLPQYDVWPLFSHHGGENYDNVVQKSQESLKSLLDTFIELQVLLLSKNSETKNIMKPGKVSNPKDESFSDEEIPSDTEDESETEGSDGDDVGLKRKLHVDEYGEFLKKRRTDLLHFRNTTIQKWSDEMKVSSGKINKQFASFEQSALKQIEQRLQDKDELLRRTQLKRYSYELLGKDLALDIENGQGQTVSGQEAILKQDFHLKDLDAEIFDDNDFYQKILREFIEHTTDDIKDSGVVGKQWLEILQMRNKLKRNKDTKASKGRKIRFHILSKLVNVMAPEEDYIHEESRNGLISSLFGGSASQTLV